LETNVRRSLKSFLVLFLSSLEKKKSSREIFHFGTQRTKNLFSRSTRVDVSGRENFFFLSNARNEKIRRAGRRRKNIFNYRCLDNKLKISTDLLLSNTSREVTSTSVFSVFSMLLSEARASAYSHDSWPEL
jgi:hypothetical protein